MRRNSVLMAELDRIERWDLQENRYLENAGYRRNNKHFAFYGDELEQQLQKDLLDKKKMFADLKNTVAIEKAKICSNSVKKVNLPQIKVIIILKIEQ